MKKVFKMLMCCALVLTMVSGMMVFAAEASKFSEDFSTYTGYSETFATKAGSTKYAGFNVGAGESDTGTLPDGDAWTNYFPSNTGAVQIKGSSDTNAPYMEYGKSNASWYPSGRESDGSHLSVDIKLSDNEGFAGIGGYIDCRRWSNSEGTNTTTTTGKIIGVYDETAGAVIAYPIIAVNKNKLVAFKDNVVTFDTPLEAGVWYTLDLKLNGNLSYNIVLTETEGGAEVCKLERQSAEGSIWVDSDRLVTGFRGFRRILLMTGPTGEISEDFKPIANAEGVYFDNLKLWTQAGGYGEAKLPYTWEIVGSQVNETVGNASLGNLGVTLSFAGPMNAATMLPANFELNGVAATTVNYTTGSTEAVVYFDVVLNEDESYTLEINSSVIDQYGASADVASKDALAPGRYTKAVATAAAADKSEGTAQVLVNGVYGTNEIQAAFVLYDASGKIIDVVYSNEDSVSRKGTTTLLASGIAEKLAVADSAKVFVINNAADGAPVAAVVDVVISE